MYEDIEIKPEKLTKLNIPPKTNFGETHLDRRFVPSRATPEAIAVSWNTGFTDPAAHDETRFKYLVHGLQGKAGEIVQILHAIDRMKRGEGDLLQMIDLLEQPYRIGNKKIISASVIDQDHRITFGNGGLILKTPFENILDAAPQDIGTDFVNPDKEINTSDRRLCPSMN